MKMHCWKCDQDMEKIKDTFHGFNVHAWKCGKCNEVIYDEEDIQPILKYNKLKKGNKITVTVGSLGKSKIFRFPKIAEHLYSIHKGEKLTVDLKPGEISIKIKED